MIEPANVMKRARLRNTGRLGRGQRERGLGLGLGLEFYLHERGNWRTREMKMRPRSMGWCRAVSPPNSRRLQIRGFQRTRERKRGEWERGGERVPV